METVEARMGKARKRPGNPATRMATRSVQGEAEGAREAMVVDRPPEGRGGRSPASSFRGWFVRRSPLSLWLSLGRCLVDSIRPCHLVIAPPANHPLDGDSDVKRG